MRHIKTYQLFESINNLELPDVWYHGTNKDFEEFTTKTFGANWEYEMLGIYFTQHFKPPPYSSSASEYARHAQTQSGGDALVYEVKLNIKNPLILDSEGWYSSNTAVDKQRNDIKRWLKADKYDGIIVHNSEYTEMEDKDFIAVVFDPKNIEIIKKHKI